MEVDGVPHLIILPYSSDMGDVKVKTNEQMGRLRSIAFAGERMEILVDVIARALIVFKTFLRVEVGVRVIDRIDVGADRV